jgi:PhoPQ-activated pathogenicity-related protein
VGEPEHPEFEYRNMPVRGLVELQKIADMLSQRLPEITCPVTIIQGSNDPVVDPESANIIYDRIGSLDKKLHVVKSDRHSILHDDIDNTQEIIIARLKEFAATSPSSTAVRSGLFAQVNSNVLRLIAPIMRGRKSTNGKNEIDQS